MKSICNKKVMMQCIFFASLALLTCLILNSGYFLRVPVLGEFNFIETVFWTSALTVVYSYAFSDIKNEGKRRSLCAFVCGILMGLMTLLGIRYSLNEIITISAVRSLIAFGAVTLLFTGAVSSLFHFCWSYHKRVDCTKGINSEKSIGNSLWKQWIIWFFLTMLIYIPVFLAVYPGIYSYDASIQVMQLYGVHPLTTHHPLLHSLYLYLCFQTGEILFQSYQAGMAIHALSQAVFMAALFSLVLCRMKKRGAPFWFLFVSWLFLVGNPYITVFSFVTTKDVVYGAFFLLLFDLAMDFADNPDVFVSRKSCMLAFFGTALFMCLFRNQGIYVYWFYVLIYACSLMIPKVKKKVEGQRNNTGSRKTAGRFILLSLLMSVCWYVLTGPVPSALGIGKGDAREMFSVPMQQLARVWTVEQDSLTEEECSYIETLIAPEALEAYVRVNADPVKSGFCTPILKADPGKFLSVWSSVGRKNPDHYFDSFCMGNWGYWYPGESQYWIDYILFDGAFMELEHNILNIHRNTKFPVLEQKLREITKTPVFDKIPVLSFLLNQAFPFWLMLTAALWLIWRKEYRFIIPLALIFGYWGTLLLGPVTSVRYVLPMLYCVPRMAELFLGNRK